MLRKTLLALAITLAGITLVIAVIVGVLFVSNAGNHVVAATVADDPSLPYVELGGYRFHARTFGHPSNPTVIALHGGPGGDFRSILPLSGLADDYFVVFYDQRGAGLSPRVAEDELHVDRYVEDLNLIVDRFSPKRQVYLVGHSWGAMLASVYLERHGEKVAGVVLAEPGFLDHKHMELWNARTGLIGGAPNLAMIGAMAGAWGASLHVSGPDAFARADYMMQAFLETDVDSHPLAGYYANRDLSTAAGESWRFGALASRAVQRSGFDEDGRMMDLAAGANAWSGEALFLAGSENTIIGPEHQRSQMGRFRNASLAVIDGAGHTMIGEKPADSLRVIRAFMERLDPLPLHER